MSSSRNVIDMQKYRSKEQKSIQDSSESKLKEGFKELKATDVITDISTRRKEILEQEKRTVKRTMLTEFVTLHVVVPNQGLNKCTLVNISEDGLAFEIPEEQGSFKKGEQIALRVYLNHKTYFPFYATVTHSKYQKDSACYMMGCSFHKDTINEIALYHFSSFIENVSAFLKTDHGDVMVSNANSIK